MISIIITTYGGSEKLHRAIVSVLEQRYTDLEIIVVDDNDASCFARRQTERIMKEFANEKRVTYVKHERNLNGAAARNTGISIAKGEFVAFLDDDDYYLPERLEKSVMYLSSHPEMVGVYVGVDLQDENDIVVMRIRPQKNLEVSDLLLNEMVLGTGSNIFVRKNVIDQVHGFDQTFVRRQDIEFMIRICQQGTVGFLEEKLVIKSVNGVMNHPKYFKMKKVLIQFRDKFEKEINELGEAKNKYYALQYRTLFGIALYEHDSDEIRESMQLMKKYSRLTIKERLLAFVYIHNIRENFIVSSCIQAIRKIKSGIK